MASPAQMQQKMQKPRRQGRLQLITLVAVAAASALGAFLLFVGVRGSGVWGTTNHGEFVTPPLAVSALQLRDAEGRPFVSEGRWWLWVTAPQGCKLSCEAALDRARNVQTLLHKDAQRLRRGLLVGAIGGQPAPDVPQFVGELGLLKAGAYIVDPLGNLVLWYSFDDVGKPLLQDLKRLLKVSQIG